jgi:hypothetical protein
MDIYDVIRQDFAAATTAFNESDFSQVNLYANRLMANVLFGTTKEYGLVGFFLKNLAIEFLKTEEDSELRKNLRPLGTSFISKMNEALKPDLDLQRIWEAYFVFAEASRKLSMTPVEQRVYRDNKAFTEQAFSFLTRELYTHGAVFHEHGLVSKAVIVEAERIIRVHGGEEKHLVLFSLFQALDRLIDYIRIACSSSGPETFKSTVSPWLDRINAWCQAGENLPYLQATDILSDIVWEWRRLFMGYMEMGRVSTSEERKIELPLEAKKRLSNTIAQALQKDLEKSSRSRKAR